VLVTGASGFIGRQALAPLTARGYEVVALSRRSGPEMPGVRWYRADLLAASEPRRVVDEVRPTHVLHLAWYAEPGQFWSSPENVRWVAATAELLLAFEAAGGGRFVGAGTCAEYDWSSNTACAETTTPIRPSTPYGRAKDAARLIAEGVAARGAVSAAWGRIFHLYGPHEHPSRFVASVTRALVAGEPARCTAGTQVRDFLHVADAGDAFAALVDCNAAGPVNIASGQPVTIASIARLIAELTGRPDLLQLGALSIPPGDPAHVVADVARLRDEVGWSPKRTLQDGLADTVRWWRGAR
jgi:nucleoside-diphosphate-sugar epimerase